MLVPFKSCKLESKTRAKVFGKVDTTDTYHGPYAFENYVDMTETHLQSITNSGTWMLILVPTYSSKIFIGQTAITTYIIPFVVGMLLARDSVVGILIPSSISLLTSLFTRSIMHHPITNS